MRDFLLVQISIDKANRAGVLANLTLKEFRRASKEDDRFVVNVREHKTFHIHGNAQAVLTSNLHNRMNVFIQEVTSQVPGIGVDENQPVFPSFNGTKMQFLLFLRSHSTMSGTSKPSESPRSARQQ